MPDGQDDEGLAPLTRIRLRWNDLLGYLEFSENLSAWARLIPLTSYELGYLELSDGSGEDVSEAEEARIIYNDITGSMQVSIDGGSYEELLASGAEILTVPGVSGRKTTNEYDPSWLTVGALSFDPRWFRTTGRVMSCQALIFTEDAAADVDLRFLNLTTGTALASWSSASTDPVLVSTVVAVGANLLNAANIIQVQLRKGAEGTTSQNAVCDMAQIMVDYS